ncbi:MAG TPA: hypothetical protein VMN36_11430 [Verrucomicrobiales bacterium]|nr:hypothetical protein [Verrucomicrobiales bacterium]
MMRKSLWILAAAFWLVTGTAAYYLGTLQGRRSAENAGSAGAAGQRHAPSLLGENGGARLQSGDAAAGAPSAGSAAAGEVSVGQATYSNLNAWFTEVSSLLGGGMMNQRNMVRAFQLTQALRQEDVPKALAMAEELPDDQRKMFMLSGVLSRMAEFDGPGAVAYLQTSQEGGSMRAFLGGAIHGVMGAWVENDPDAAWKWFEEESKKEPISSARSPLGAWSDPASVAAMPLFQQLANKDLGAAIAKLDSLSSQQAKSMALQGIISTTMFGGNREEMLAQVENIEDNSLRQTAYQQVLQFWAGSDPEEAAAWYESNGPEDPDGNVRRQLASSWLMRDPNKAADWWFEETPEEKRADILPQIVSSWGYQDPEGAQKWLNTFDPGPELDPAVSALVHATARTNPQQALELAATMSEDSNRHNAVEQAIRVWSETDRSAALDYLRSTQALPADRVENLQQQLQPQPVEETP